MVNNCVVHGCKYGCAVLSNTYADFASTEFRDCELYTMFELYSSKAYFYACSFERLEGTLLSTDINSEAYFYDCLFDADAYQSLMTGTNQYGMVSVY